MKLSLWWKLKSDNLDDCLINLTQKDFFLCLHPRHSFLKVNMGDFF